MSSIKPLPPGSNGLPLVGETLSFAKNPFQFIEERLAKHGPIFRTRVLGRNTAVIAGPEAAGRFIDTRTVARTGSMPPHVQELFAGRSLPLLDGDIHRNRKSIVNQAFTRAAITSYLPPMQASIERAFAGWTDSSEIRWLDALKQLAIEVICSNFIGLEPGAGMDALRRDYGAVTGGFATLPINLPGTRYRKALQARDRIIAFLRKSVRERRAAPSADGVSRIIAGAALPGSDVTDDDIALELHHIVIAGFIVFGELGAMIQQLTQHPEVRAKLAAEVAAVSPSGPITLETLMKMPYLLQVVNETKRLTPIIPGVFGIAKNGFELDGVSVPAGWMLIWTIYPTHVRHGVYSNPAAFDPDRFSAERAEEQRHEHAFVPQGAGAMTGHRCPGLDYATYFMEVFAIVLLRNYTWELPPQDFTLNYSMTPPEPADGLRATVRKQ